MDRKTNRLFVGCSGTSVVVDASNGKVIAQIKNGSGVDAINVGWDQSEKLIYIPSGQGERQRHGRTRRFAGQVHHRRNRHDFQGRPDVIAVDDVKLTWSISSSPRVWAGAGAGSECSGSGARWARTEGADGGGLVHCDEALSDYNSEVNCFLLVGWRR